MSSKNVAVQEVSGEVLPSAIPVEGKLALSPLKISVSIGPNATSEQAISAVDSICEAMGRQERSVTFLRVTLGKFIAEIQRRKLFKPEFKSFEAFLGSLDKKYGLKRTVITDILASVTILPRLEPADAEDIPLQSLKLITQVVRNRQLAPPAVKKILADARKNTFTELRGKLEEDGLVGPAAGRPTGGARTTGSVALRVVVTARVASRFRSSASANEMEPGKYLEHLLLLDKKKAS